MNKFITMFLILAVVLGQNAFAVVTASVTASPTTAYINQKVTANVAISNTGTSDITLRSLVITATANGKQSSRPAAAFSVFNTGPNAPIVTILAGGGVTVPMQAVFFAPSSGITGAATTSKYFIGALVQTSDGSVTSAATAGQVRVDPLLLPASERQ